MSFCASGGRRRLRACVALIACATYQSGHPQGTPAAGSAGVSAGDGSAEVTGEAGGAAGGARTSDPKAVPGKPARIRKAVALITKAPASSKADAELVKAFDEEFARVCAALKRHLVAGPASPWGLSPFVAVQCRGEQETALTADSSTLVFRIEMSVQAKTFSVTAWQVGAGPEALAEADNGVALKAKASGRATVRATRAALTKMRARRFSRLLAAQLVDGLPFFARIESESHPAFKVPDSNGADAPSAPDSPSTPGSEALPKQGAPAVEPPADAEGALLPPGPREFDYVQLAWDPATRALKQTRVSASKAKTLWPKASIWVVDKAGRGRNRRDLAGKIADATRVVDPYEASEEEAPPAGGSTTDAGWTFRGQALAGGLRDLNLSSGGFSVRGALRLGLGGPYPGYPYALVSYGRSKIFLVTEGDAMGKKVSVTLTRARYGGGWRGEFPFANEAIVFVIGPYAALERGSLTTQGIDDDVGGFADDLSARLYGGEGAIELNSSRLSVSFFGGVERSFGKGGGYSSWTSGASASYLAAQHEMLGRTWKHSLQLIVNYDTFRFALVPKTGERMFDVGLSVSQPALGLGYLLFW